MPYDPLVFEIAASATRPKLATERSVLTSVEREALLAARAMGDYGSPNRAHLDALAKRMKMPRATTHDHLQRAERKVLDATWLPPHAG